MIFFLYRSSPYLTIKQTVRKKKNHSFYYSQWFKVSKQISILIFLCLSSIGPVLNRNIHINGTVIDTKRKLSLSICEHVEDTTKVSPRNNLRLFLSLTIGSLGIIFGDIGTSPLYVIHTIFAENLTPTHQQCIGAISLIIWNLIIVVSIKYAVFILMADNRGEGGTFALCGLLTGENSKLRARAKHIISIVSILAASLLIGKRINLIVGRENVVVFLR
jgi:hypothetical protein